jgi:hypothetical protein
MGLLTPGKIVYTKSVSNTVPDYLKRVLGDDLRWQLKWIPTRVSPRIKLVSTPIYRAAGIRSAGGWGSMG